MKYFGTDGIRGAYKGPCVNEAFFEKLGAAAVRHLQKNIVFRQPVIAIAGDPRFSSESLKSAFCKGLKSAKVLDFGTVPTPALAFGVLDCGADLGVMITASHNSASDNGIKFFDSNAQKISDEVQLELENFLDANKAATGEICVVEKIDMASKYIAKMGSLLPADFLRGKKIVLDCANGATAGISGKVLRAYGAEVFEIGVSPDGGNINENIGSEHTEKLCKLVSETQSFIGLAHDGDGDRLVVVDSSGVQIAGECILGAIALAAKAGGSLEGGAIVTTMQSNMGLDDSLLAKGIKVLRSGIGDRLVMRMMLENKCAIGGENSGHYIFTDVSPCGDGLAAALKLLSTLDELKISVSELGELVSLYPSLQKAVKVAVKTPIPETRNLSKSIGRAEAALAGKGRVLVRYSGTEDKIRLLVEGKDSSLIEGLMADLLKSVENDLQ